MFNNRREAGRKLALALARFKDEQPVILAYEIAVALRAALDVVIVRKLGAPGQPELGIGAIVDGDQPESVLDADSVRLLQVSKRFIEDEIAQELKEIHRRQELYRGKRPPVLATGRTVIVVDDGIATGSSVRAALRGLRRAAPRKLVLAVPVAPSDTLDSLRPEVDEIVCLATPPIFHAVGQFYSDFRQTSDEEVIELLDAAACIVTKPEAA